MPIFTRRLAFMPFDLGHRVWVKSEDVDMDHHIRKVPGGKLTVKQVEAAAARLHGVLVDRERPLWEFHVFDSVVPPAGLQFEGRVVGFYSKIHHAALDGKGGTVLANAILDLGPVPREVPPPDPARRGRSAGDLRIGEMIGAVFSNSLAQYAKLARAVPAAAGSLGGMAKRSLAAKGGPSVPMQLAPRTIFNVGINDKRAFATATIPFGPARALAKVAGGSFNDIVLWVCSTALRSYLAQHGTVPRKPLVAAMPVSLREESNKELNNQASMPLVQLGTHLADPHARMQAIVASTSKVKDALAGLKTVLPTDYPSLLAPWLVGGAGRMALKAYGRSGVTERLLALANLAISTVPGPQQPLYLAGARMLTFHPLSIILHGLPLNMTIQTYAGRVHFGLIASPGAVPQLRQLAHGIEAAFQEAVVAFGAEAAKGTPPPAKSAVKARRTARPTPKRKPAPKKAAPARARCSGPHRAGCLNPVGSCRIPGECAGC